jgi:hypothetical protein
VIRSNIGANVGNGRPSTITGNAALAMDHGEQTKINNIAARQLWYRRLRIFTPNNTLWLWFDATSRGISGSLTTRWNVSQLIP